MAVFNEPTKWAQTLGKDADVANIPDTAGETDPSIDKIFPSVFSIPLARGGRAIPRSVLNGLFKLLGDNIFYLQQGGVFSYSDTANYGRGAFVKYNNELYLCIQDNSSFNKHAPTDAEYWLRVALNNDLANYLPLAGGNITGNLTVQNKNVVRSVNWVNADENGNVHLGNLGVITGKIEWFAFNTVPDGYIICNGANVSRTTYAKLFAVIGTKFGSGDGSTTFALPNLIDKFAQGSTTVGTVKSAGLPNITGSMNDRFTSGDHELVGNGAFYANDQLIVVRPAEGIDVYAAILNFDASRSNSIYGNSPTVQPPALTLLPCIKY